MEKQTGGGIAMEKIRTFWNGLKKPVKRLILAGIVFITPGIVAVLAMIFLAIVGQFTNDPFILIIVIVLALGTIGCVFGGTLIFIIVNAVKGALNSKISTPRPDISKMSPVFTSEANPESIRRAKPKGYYDDLGKEAEV